MDVDELRALMTECMGPDSAEAFAGDGFLTASFAELDFDSLARIELAEQLKALTGADLPNDFVDRAASPGDLLARINDALAATAGPAEG